MNKKNLGIGIAGIVAILAVLYAVGAFSGGTLKELTGTITYRERVALPAGSVIEVKLQNVSNMDVPATVIAESTILTTGENVPIPFTLKYDPARIDARYSYSVSARILIDGELSWITTSNVPVLTGDAPPSDVEVLVSQVESDEEEIVACTMDVQECPDGSFVSRTPPNCAFAKCPAPNPILGTKWKWQRTEFLNGTKTAPQDSGKFIIAFGEDKRMTSTTDCNNIFSPFVVDNEILSIGPIASTKMACAPGSLETEYTQELLRAVSHVIAGDELRVILVKDSGTMVFTKHVAVNLDGTTFRLTSFNNDAIAQGTNYTLAFSGNSLSAKFCNGMGGEYKLAGGVLTANIVGTKMYCETPNNLMTMENTFGAILRDGANFSLEGSTLTLTGDGEEEMVFTVFMD